MGYEQNDSEHKERSEVKEPDLAGTYTASDYLSWTFDGLMELIRGKIHKMSPAPASNHQRLVGRLHANLYSRLTGKTCEVWLSPFDVYLVKPGEDYRETGNIVEPDLCVICDPGKVREFGCVGSPDFIIEILSPSTAKKDAGSKLRLYEEYGVKEYWMISYIEKLVFVNVLNAEGTYITEKPKTVEDTISPKAFPGIKVDLASLFADLSQ